MIEPMSESSRSLFDVMKYITTFVSLVVSSLAVFVLARYLPYATSTYRALLIGTTVSNNGNHIHLKSILGHLGNSGFSPSNCDGSSVHDPTSMLVFQRNSRYSLYVRGLREIAKKYTNKIIQIIIQEIWVTGVGSISLFYWFCALYRNQVCSIAERSN